MARFAERREGRRIAGGTADGTAEHVGADVGECTPRKCPLASDEGEHVDTTEERRPVACSPTAMLRRRLAAARPAMHHRGMTKYLISFPSEAMQVSDADLPAVGDAARAVIEDAKVAGVYVFGGGIHEGVDPVLVSGDGSVSPDIYPGSRLKGGFTVLEVPTREEAVEWARKIAVACRCAQELREFMYDPAS